MSVVRDKRDKEEQPAMRQSMRVPPASPRL